MKLFTKQHLKQVSPEQAIENLHNNVHTQEDIDAIVKAYYDTVPYLRYCTEEKLDMVRSAEIIGVLKKVFNRNIGKKIGRSISKLANSTKFIPESIRWTGLGNNWGEIIGGFVFTAALQKLALTIANKTGVNIEGLTDQAGLKERRDALPEDARFKLKGKHWVGKNIDCTQVINTGNNHIKRLDELMTFAKGCEQVMLGKLTLEKWGSNALGGKDSKNFIANYANKQVSLVKTETGFKTETAPLNNPIATDCELPYILDFPDIQKTGRLLQKRVEKFNSEAGRLLINLSKIQTDENGLSALKITEVLLKKVNEINIELTEAYADYINEAIASILTMKPSKEAAAKNPPMPKAAATKVEETDAKADAKKVA